MHPFSVESRQPAPLAAAEQTARAGADNLRLVSRQKIFDDDSGVYSHPALVGKKLYLRGSDEIVCLKLDG